MNYEVKRISIDRQRDLFALFKSAFGATVSASSLSAKHNTEFAGARDIGLIAYASDGNSAAYYGVFPVYVRIRGEVFLVAQSGDTMVDPNHGGKGLFTMLAKKTYDIAKEEGILGVFGFPSASSYPGFIKRLGWKHFENIHRYRFIVPMLPISELLWKIPVIRRFLMRWQYFLLKIF